MTSNSHPQDITWPRALVNEIAAQRAAVFLGAGVSRSATNLSGARPPTWIELLTKAATEAGLDLTDEQNGSLRGLIESRPLDAAEIICGEIDATSWRDFLQAELVEPAFEASDLHRQILDLEPTVVLTTNYDKIFDSLLTHEGWTTVKNSEGARALDVLRSSDNLYVKLHGCVSRANETVLARSDYFNARREHAQFYQSIDAIFRTHTLIFLGVGFAGDPDIELLLESITIACSPNTQHYAVVPSGEHHPSVLGAMKRSMGIHFIEYPANDHESLILALADLKSKVVDRRKVIP